MRILGIDYGDNKIGIAVSDPFGWTAQGLEVIRNQTLNGVLNRIKDIIEKYNIEKIVVGFPLNMNGTVGPRGEMTLEFIEQLKSIFKYEIIKWDERLTTTSAENVLISANVRRDKRKNIIDKIAATYILQSYLDFLTNNKKTE